MVTDKTKKKKHQTVKSKSDGNTRRPNKQVDNRGGDWTTASATRKRVGVVSESPMKRRGGQHLEHVLGKDNESAAELCVPVTNKEMRRAQ